MQVLPSTIAMLGFRGTLKDLAIPRTNIEYSLLCLSETWYLVKGDLCSILMICRAKFGEKRVSVHSVQFCRGARAIFARKGHEVKGPLLVATSGFGGARSFANSERSKKICIRRKFVPGPGYRKCRKWTVAVSQKSLIARRRALIGR